MNNIATKDFTVKGLAVHLGVHRNTVARMISSKRITAKKLGKGWRITQGAVKAYLDSITSKAER